MADLPHALRRTHWWCLALMAVLLCLGAGVPEDQGEFSPPPVPTSVPAWRAAQHVAIISVHGEIDNVTRASVLRRMRQAQAAGAGGIVLELDTPGGDLASTLELCRALKDDTRVPVVAWIRPQAYSAGTILALAGQGVLVTPNAVFGDAAPIQAFPGLGLTPLPVAERAKIEAPVLAEVVDSARRNGYDENLARAFVTVQDEVWMLRNRSTDERVFVGRAEYRSIFGEDPPVSRLPGTPAASRAPADAGYAVLPAYDDRFRQPDPVEVERDHAVELLQLRPPSRAPLTAADAPNWELLMQVDGADELLVLHTPEALAFGLAQGIASTEADAAAFFGATQITRHDEHQGDAIVRFLTSWPVRLVLVIVLLAGLFIEIAAPGVGWFGAAATMALLVLLGAPALAGLQNWWPVLVVLAGVALVVLEIFVIPGVGVAGFLGGGCIIVGLVAAFVEAPLSTPQGQDDLINALALVVVGGSLAVAVAWGVVRALPRSKLLRGAVLQVATGEVGPGHSPSADVPVSAGQRGVTVTDLRPVGKVNFQGRLIEVQAVGGYVDAGRTVVVVRASAYAVEVEEPSS